MTSLRFHKAAKDGYIEVLKEATRSDCNAKDEQGMTPTLYAAFHGHLDALRLLCGRGGNPDKADHFGNTALHLAAAQGHKAVVTFLVNFGANIYAMDIDERTAKELAGMNNRDDIMVFLDNATAKLETTDKKRSKEMKEKARKDAEKRIKKFNKRQAKLYESTDKNHKKSNTKLFSTLKNRIKRHGSMSNLQNDDTGPLHPRISFSAIVGGNGTTRGITSTVQRKAMQRQKMIEMETDDFKVSEVEDGKRSVRSLTGYRRDSEVLYTGQVESPKRGRLNGVFNGTTNGSTKSEDENEEDDDKPGQLTRSVSQPNFMLELNNNDNQEPASIFVRPGIGSLAFRKSITNTLQAMSLAEAAVVEASSIGSAGSLAARQRHNGRTFDEDLSDIESTDEEDNSVPLERFLTAWGLQEYLPKFEEQKIDLDTLILLTEADLKSLKLPLGPHRKLVTAVNERRVALENPGEVIDSRL